jgi:hypothetical protein
LGVTTLRSWTFIADSLGHARDISQS